MLNISRKEEKHKLVLALDPAPRGFGYALFEAPNEEPLDWGFSEVRLNVNARCLKKIEKLIAYYKPEIVVLEKHQGKGSRRVKRICKLIDQVEQLAKNLKIPVYAYSRSEIDEFFKILDVGNRYCAAKLIAEFLPAFKRNLPQKRKPWESENPKMHIFDAVSMVLLYYYNEE